MEPKIEPLGAAVQRAGLETLSSCEGYVEDGSAVEIPRFTSVAFCAMRK